jgi:hypothetical protein
VGEQHPDYARVLGNLANYDFERGRRLEAIRLSRRSIGILAASLGPGNPEVIAQRSHAVVMSAAFQ